MRTLLVAVILSSLAACDFWEVDRCLDRGGRWNAEKNACELEPLGNQDLSLKVLGRIGPSG
jgi:hypothetical protein